VVSYDESGSATVKVTDYGKTRRVTLGVARGGPQYSCPADIDDQLAPRDKLSGRIKLTLRDVGAELDRLEARNPGFVVLPAVARRYNGLARRERRLARAFNRSVAKHNALLKDECAED
jgi:hypothetical protein